MLIFFIALMLLLKYNNLFTFDLAKNKNINILFIIFILTLTIYGHVILNSFLINLPTIASFFISIIFFNNKNDGQYISNILLGLLIGTASSFFIKLLCIIDEKYGGIF